MADRHPVPEWSDMIAQRDRQIATLRRALLEAAEKLERAGWRQSADLARDAAA